MGLDFTQRSFVFIAQSVAVGVSRFDTGAPTPQQFDLPDWVPAQVFITRAFVGYRASGQGPPGNVEIAVMIDPKGIATSEQADRSRGISVMRWVSGDERAEHVEKFETAVVVWDRDYGDKLVLYVDTPWELDWVRCEVGFLVPAGSQPVGPKSGY